jgi:hypothetical protein
LVKCAVGERVGGAQTDGSEMDFWLQAEREVRAETPSAPRYGQSELGCCPAAEVPRWLCRAVRSSNEEIPRCPRYCWSVAGTLRRSQGFLSVSDLGINLGQSFA